MKLFAFIAFVFFLSFSPLAVAIPQNLLVQYVDIDNDSEADLISISDSLTAITFSINLNQADRIDLRFQSGKNRVLIQYKKNDKSYQYSYGIATTRNIFNKSACSSLSASPENVVKDLVSYTFLPIEEIEMETRTCDPIDKLTAPIAEPFAKIVAQKKELGSCVKMSFPSAATAFYKLSRKTPSLENICIAAKGNGKSCSGQFNSKNKNIVLEEGCFENPEVAREALLHEILHASEIWDESVVQCILARCPNVLTSCVDVPLQTAVEGTSTFAQDAQIVAMGFENPTKSETYVDKNTKVFVPKEIASATIPPIPAADLKVANGIRSYTVPANSNTFPAQFFRALALRTVFSPTPANASTGAAKLATRREIKRNPSSLRPLPARAQPTATKAATTSASRPNTNLSSPAPDLPTISENSPTISGDVAASSQNKNSKSAKSKTSGTLTVRNGSRSSLALANTNSPSKSNRNPANQSASKDCQVLTRSQITSIFRDEDYNEVKKRLSDPCFKTSLDKARVIVYPNDGSDETSAKTPGAANPVMSYGDTGSRFVPQLVPTRAPR